MCLTETICSDNMISLRTKQRRKNATWNRMHHVFLRHCVKSVPTFRLNANIYRVKFCIYSESRKIRTRKSINTEFSYE